jgi:hypothetical protein
VSCEQVHGCRTASRSCFPTPQVFSFTPPPSDTSWLPSKTVPWLSDHMEQTHDGYSSHKKNYQQHLHIWSTLACFFFSLWQQFSHTLWRLSFYLNIIPIHPRCITCYDIFQTVFVCSWLIVTLFANQMGLEKKSIIATTIFLGGYVMELLMFRCLYL